MNKNPRNTELEKFAQQVHKEMDKYYPVEFDTFTRIPRDIRSRRNDMINVNVTFKEQTAHIQERIVHKREGQFLYFEITSLDRNGRVVKAPTMRSKADIIIYIIWDDIKQRVDHILGLSVRKMQALANEEYKKYSVGQDNCLVVLDGDTLQTGIQYKAVSYPFLERNLPADAYVTIEGRRLHLYRENH